MLAGGWARERLPPAGVLWGDRMMLDLDVGFGWPSSFGGWVSCVGACKTRLELHGGGSNRGTRMWHPDLASRMWHPVLEVWLK
jgi:hypothetical protein